MRELIWKEFRTHRALVLLFVAMFFVIHAIGLTRLLYTLNFHAPQPGELAQVLRVCGFFCLALTCLAAALLGGASIATERADRSAHFLAYLPPTRLQNAMSKLIVCVASLVFMWGLLAISVDWILPRWTEPALEPDTDFFSRGFGAACVLMFGVGWFASALAERPVVPFVVALFSPVILTLALDATASELSQNYFTTVCTLLGLAALIAGAWLYLRRIEP